MRDLVLSNDVPMVGRGVAGLIAGAELERLAATTRYAVIARDRHGRIKWEIEAKNRVVTAGLNKLLDATLKSGLTSPAWYVGLCAPSITDGAVSNGATTFTSASNPWLAEDVGRAIIVRGAGAAGADLLTTIASRNSAGSVELAASASTAVTGAAAIWDARAGDTMSSHASWSESSAYSQSSRPAFTPGSIASGSVDNSGSVAGFTINANTTRIGGLFLADNATKGGTTGTLFGMAPFSSVGFKQLDNGDTLSVTATVSVTSA